MQQYNILLLLQSRRLVQQFWQGCYLMQTARKPGSCASSNPSTHSSVRDDMDFDGKSYKMLWSRCVCEISSIWAVQGVMRLLVHSEQLFSCSQIRWPRRFQTRPRSSTIMQQSVESRESPPWRLNKQLECDTVRVCGWRSAIARAHRSLLNRSRTHLFCDPGPLGFRSLLIDSLALHFVGVASGRSSRAGFCEQRCLQHARGQG